MGAMSFSLNFMSVFFLFLHFEREEKKKKKKKMHKKFTGHTPGSQFLVAVKVLLIYKHPPP